MFWVRCKAGVPFFYRLGGGAYEESRSNQQRLPMFDREGQPLTYEIKVDAPADMWHRYRFSRSGVRGVEFLSSGFEFNPPLVVDTTRLAWIAGLPLGVVSLLFAVQFLRARGLRRQLAATHERLSEAEARSGLFPIDGSVPSRIDTYDVQGKLGMGGMAVVYKVARGGQEYALKLPLPNLLEDPDFRARFSREMRLGASLQHPNLVHIYDVNDGVGDFGYPYLVMELVNGLPLKERLALGGLDLSAVGRIGLQILDALAHIHGRGIVHRDIKPSNVMVTSSGNAKVMDFGIAYREETEAGRLTGTGDLLGTPLYLAPEQIGSEKQSTDPRIDVYGVGMILYEALAGRLPWSSGDSVAAVLEKVTHDPPALIDFRPDVPRPVADCVMRMIARDPAERPSDAVAAREALRAALRAASVPSSRA
jgi:serine/threonine protein kinase